MPAEDHLNAPSIMERAARLIQKLSQSRTEEELILQRSETIKRLDEVIDRKLASVSLLAEHIRQLHAERAALLAIDFTKT